MAEYLIQGETLTSMADKIRILNGVEDEMTPAEMDGQLGEANAEVGSQTDLIAQIASALEGKAGGSEPTLQSKTVTPTTSSQTVTADSGYDGLDTVTVNAMPTATQATPSVSVNSSGLITASATQAAGYVAAGTKSGTKQLTTQAAKTITPTKSSQTAVSSGVYTTGTVTIAAIPSQYITTTDATAEASEIMSGETAYVNGSKVTGTFTLDDEIATQDDLIAQIASTVDSLPDAGSGEPTLQSKTVTPTTDSQTVTADSGYDGLSSVMVNGDDNLVAENIVSGVSIFGVEGSASGGSGGGSASVESCSVQFVVTAPVSGTIVYYTDSNMNYCSMNYSETTISVPKNTIIALEGWSSMSYSSGDCTQLFNGHAYAAYIIKGNCTITYNM